MNPENIFEINWNNKDITQSNNVDFNLFEHPDFGKIFITYTAFSEEYPNFQNIDYYKFKSILRRNFLLKKETVICTKEEKIHLINSNTKNRIVITLSELLSEFPKTIIEKQRLSLLNLAKIGPDYGKEIQSFRTYDLFAKDLPEALFTLNILKEKKQIDFDISIIHNGQLLTRRYILIKEPGWIEIEKQEQTKLSRQVFIAIWFDPSMNQAYQEIENACRNNGYTPIRIDNKEHNNEISGEILFEIKKSKFLISEVTGQRHGVYFEAGYAMGLGLPVIWCCKQSDLSNVHFDTRQYNHVVWDSTEELFDKLDKRIRSTI